MTSEMTGSPPEGSSPGMVQVIPEDDGGARIAVRRNEVASSATIERSGTGAEFHVGDPEGSAIARILTTGNVSRPGGISPAQTIADWPASGIRTREIAAALACRLAVLPAGTRVGSCRKIAAEHGTSKSTVTRAVYLLMGTGFIHKSGRHYYTGPGSSRAERQLEMDKFDTKRPNAARMYDYALLGKDNLPVDRDAADAILAVSPRAFDGARQNRAFLRRACAYVASKDGVDQFIDIGAGLPTTENTHQVVQSVNKSARVAYADNDHSKSGCAHARAQYRCPAKVARESR